MDTHTCIHKGKPTITVIMKRSSSTKNMLKLNNLRIKFVDIEYLGGASLIYLNECPQTIPLR